MKFKFLNTEIYVSFLFIAIIALMLATDRTGLLMPSLFAVLIHEIAHLFAMWLVECAPKKIRLIPASIQIIRNFGISNKNEILVAAFGPITNLLLFFVLIINYISFGNPITQYYALINLIVGVFNLLPVSGLDGGTILLEVLSKKMEYSRAALILRIITLLICILTAVIAFLMALKGQFNPSVYILIIYFFVMFLMKL